MEHPPAPQATVHSIKRKPWWLLLPLGVLIATIVVVYRSVIATGIPITLTFPHGQGLETGSELRYQGITVGQVEDLNLQPQGDGVSVRLRLDPSAKHLAREGSLFWVVRPEISSSGIDGLDTLIGARYLSVIPGNGSAQRSFQGLAKAPIMADLEPGGLEVVLLADRLGSLSEGAAIRYRQVEVGKVLSVALASDASAVVVRAYIEPKYRNLIREHTKFWNTSGIRAQVGVTGAKLKVDSLGSLIKGGVSLATPEQAGEAVATGHQFTLFEDQRDDWLEWRPSLPIGEPLAQQFAPLPIPHRNELQWQESGWMGTSTASYQAWVLLTQGGLLGLKSALLKPADASEEAATISVKGESFAILTTPSAQSEYLALLPVAPAGEPWPQARLRAAQNPEDFLLIGDANKEPLLVSRNRYSKDQQWLLEKSDHRS